MQYYQTTRSTENTYNDSMLKKMFKNKWNDIHFIH